MKKRVLSFLLALLLFISMSLPTNASTVMPRFLYIELITVCLEIDNIWGIASCEGSVSVESELPVKVIVDLQRYVNGSWVTIKRWEAEGIKHAFLEARYAISSGYNYRTYVQGFVYDENGSIIESASKCRYRDYY